MTSIDAHRGRVRVVASDQTLDLHIAIDGVAEPELSVPFAGVMREIARGTFDPQGTAAVQLQNVSDSLPDRFRDVDDQMITVATASAAAIVTALLVFALPEILFIAMRPPVARDAFLLASHLSPADPRIDAAAVAGGVLATWIVAAVTLGAHAGPWLRGTLRGWHLGGRALIQRPRRALAFAMGAPKIAGAVFAVAVLLSVPSARSQATLDPRGVHVFGSLPLQDRDATWSEVTEIAKIPAGGETHRDGFAVVVRSADLTVSTAQLRLQNGTDAYFFETVTRWRGR